MQKYGYREAIHVHVSYIVCECVCERDFFICQTFEKNV